jgi:hypothetical protein
MLTTDFRNTHFQTETLNFYRLARAKRKKGYTIWRMENNLANLKHTVQMSTDYNPNKKYI